MSRGGREWGDREEEEEEREKERSVGGKGGREGRRREVAEKKGGREKGRGRKGSPREAMYTLAFGRMEMKTLTPQYTR